jgi:hypothetical protein
MCFYHKATDLVTRLYGAQGAMSSTIATWTNKGDCRVQWSVKSEGIWRFFGSFSGAITLRSAGEMAVDICGHLDVRVAQPLLHVFQAVALRQQHAGAGVPLQYNYDKPEKPRRIKGFEVFSLAFSSFSKPKNHTEISRIIGGVSLTRLPVS